MMRLLAILAVLLQSVCVVIQPRGGDCCAGESACCGSGGSCCDSGDEKSGGCCGGGSTESCGGCGAIPADVCRLISTDRGACLLAQLTGLCDGCECCWVEGDGALMLLGDSASKKGLVKSVFAGLALPSYPLVTAPPPDAGGAPSHGDVFVHGDHRRRSVLNVWTI